MANTHPFILTEDEVKAVGDLYGPSFPNPTLRQAARSSKWGPVGGRGDDYYKGHELRCGAAMNKLIAKGLCEEHDGRFFPTQLTGAYRAYERQGRLLNTALDSLDRLAQLTRELEREIVGHHRRLERGIHDAR